VILTAANASFSVGTCVWAVRHYGVRWPSGARVRGLYRRMLPFAVMVLFSTALDRYDYLVVEAIGSDETIGLYGGVLRLFSAIQSLVPALALAFGCEMLATRDDETLARYARHAMDLTSAFVLAMAVGSWFVAPDLLAIVYDDTYRRAAPALALLCFSAAPYSVIVVVGWYVLMTRDRASVVAKSLAVGLGVGAIVAVLFAAGPSSLGGIAASVVIGKAVTAVLVYRAAADLVGKKFWRPVLLNAVAAAVMGAVLVATKPANLAWPYTIAIGAVVFAALQIALRGKAGLRRSLSMRSDTKPAI
jgi:O-antigen/teichoic acid export membrane protein